MQTVIPVLVLTMAVVVDRQPERRATEQTPPIKTVQLRQAAAATVVTAGYRQTALALPGQRQVGGGGGALRGGNTDYSGGAGAGGKVVITYRYNTTTAVSCTPNPVTYGSTTVCTATVTRGGSSYNVTGTVAWTTADAVTFDQPVHAQRRRRISVLLRSRIHQPR